MATTTNLDTLKINYLTQAQYDNAKTNNQINANELYLTPHDDNYFLNLVYPVGAIYISTVSTSPATLFGGTWEQIQDTFLLAAGSTYSAGGTGGSADAIVPYHRHSVSAVTGGITGGAHSHDPSTTSEYFVTSDVSSAYNAGFTTGASGQSRRIDAPEASTAIFHHRATTNSPTHTHDLPAHNTGYAGTSGNTTGANMPPYLAVYVWKRTA